MLAERFARVEMYFDQVVAAPAGLRRSLLAERCEDTTVRREVQELLEIHERLDTGSLSSAVPPKSGLEPGTRLGAYRVVDRIGAGGMGEVYRASRADDTFEREVAVKVLRAGDDGAVALERFVRERRILASLQHPGIVTLLDGGITAEGLAYFVMELVEGLPLSRYCEERQLSLAGRLALVRRVCEAVEYAHQRAVVHRDLKPANVLVTTDGQPKVLDFGVAALLAHGAHGDLTRGLQPVPLTPNYASPEQLRGAPVTTASDVYALGVLLYEVVAGERPYETSGLTFDAVLQVVNARTHAAPSQALGERTLGRPTYTGRDLRGDVDAIVLKALRRDPAERYASPRDLAEDLARVERREPVQARPPSFGYLSRRFAVRHRGAVTAAVVALLLVLTALGITAWQWQVARSQQARAERRFADVRALASKVLFDYQETLREMGGASDLRARMAADSLSYLGALSGETTDESVLVETARGYLAVAEVQGSTRSGSIGDQSGALRSLAKARALLDDLARLSPDNAAARETRAQFGCAAARIDTARARQHARDCLTAIAPLAAGRQADDPLVIRQGHAHMLLVEAGAIEHAAAARAVFEPLVDHPRAGRRIRLNLALVHRLVGRAVLSRDPSRARAEGARAMAVMAPVVRGAPLATRIERAFTLQLIGQADVALGRRDEGRAALEEAVALARAAHRDNPNDAFLQDRVISAWFQLALAMDGVDAHAQARAARDGVADIPAMTLRLGASERERGEGYLLAVHARLGFPTPPCDLLVRAHDRFQAAPRAGLSHPKVASTAAWAARLAQTCRPGA